MTEREKNGERLAMKISRHRQAKHEAIQYEDVKTAYIKGCEDTAKENAKARALLEKWLQTEHHYNAINAACEELVLRTETEQFLAGDL